MDEILSRLETTHGDAEQKAQMKGSLYLILGGRGGSLVLKHDWRTLAKCFPALVRVNSDSKTCTQIFDKLAERINRSFTTTTIHAHKATGAIEMAETILAKQSSLLLTSNGRIIADDDGPATATTLDAVWEKRAVQSADNEKLYSLLVAQLVEFVRERVTKPKNFHFALFVLSFLSEFEG